MGEFLTRELYEDGHGASLLLLLPSLTQELYEDGHGAFWLGEYLTQELYEDGHEVF
jgi:hypothetical protein